MPQHHYEQLLQCQNRFRLNAAPTLSHEEKLALRVRDGNQWRRSHTKSKLGCAPCKKARVKCSEGRPRCERCAKRRIFCVYGKDDPPATPSDLILPSTSSSLSRAAPATAQTPASPSLPTSRRNGPDSPIVSTIMQVYKLPRPTAVDSQVLLGHFVTQTSSRLIAEDMQSTYQKHIVPLAMSKSALWHAILAISSRHLMFLQPSTSDYRTAYYYHTQQAATTMVETLRKPPTAEIGVLAHCTIFLLNVIAFADPWFGQSGSWVFSNDQQDLDRAFSWLRLQASHQRTLRVYDTLLDDSDLYKTIFADNGPRRDHQNSVVLDAVEIPQPFARLCGIESTSTESTNKYYHALYTLQRVFKLDKSPPQAPYFGVYTAFISEMREDFLELLRCKDERALVIFAYWLCQLSYLEVWWTVERARNECRAICTFLQTTGSDEVRRLLDYPVAVVSEAVAGHTPGPLNDMPS